ncbi:signal peptidase II [bacterium]|nr:signal peptidase II [bacterium]
MKKQNLYFLVMMFIYSIDRFTKGVMFGAGNREIRISSFLSLKTHLNRGVSWGMFHSEGTIPFILVTLLTIAIIIPLVLHAVKQRRLGRSVWGETLALIGALSNLVDRFMYGGVVDFISFSYAGWSFPIFNIADVCIVFGVLLIFLGLYKES